MNMHEIEEEIYRLENGDTSWRTCEKLNILYGVKNGLNKQTTQDGIQTSSYRAESEFANAFMNAPIEYSMPILEEHFECIKALYPQEYKAIINRLKNVHV